ncbi:hypothetical protein GF362_04585 [Candidatus Dojkabacteria bacterium]|nr:hypothetical protein [Candidatus Dojkabacteria bacterium]
MKKLVLIFFLFVGLLFSFTWVEAQENTTESKSIDLHFFWSNSCTHCHKAKPFLENLAEKYDHVELKSYEISENDNEKLAKQSLKKIGERYRGVPIVIIGPKAIVGYDTDAIKGQEIENLLEETLNLSQYRDPVEEIKDGNYEKIQTQEEIRRLKDIRFHVPLIGEVNAGQFSLPVLTVILGVLDGFNPCAMWALMFLISLLLGMKDKKRMWTLGTVFIVVSAVMYYILMFLWLSFFEVIGYQGWLQKIIGIVALGAAIYSFYDFYTNKEGACKVSNNKKRKTFFEKLKKITKKQNLLIALIGISALAVSVNLVEVVCSAGLPAIYTQVLTLSDLSKLQYHAYLLIYIFFFMIDDLFVFFSAMVTLHMVGIHGKYSRVSRFVGGIIMLVLGILLIFKPEWLMFT